MSTLTAAGSKRAASPLVDAILSGQAPPPVRLAAARGALPVSRAERLLLCVHLLADGEAGVRQAAAERLASEGAGELLAALDAGEPMAAQVLEHFARRKEAPAALQEKLAVHASLSDAALAELAGSPHPTVLERIVINQTRLLASRDIVLKLVANPRLGAEGRRLLTEFKQEFWDKNISQSIAVEPAAAPADAAPETAVEPAMPEEGAAAAGEEAAEAQAPELTPEEAADAEFKAAYVRMMQLSVPEKIGHATKASREERAILVRDSNKQVAAAVLKSPKLSEQEVEQIANMRNVSEEVLRIVASSRNWTRNYAVIHSLCRNPKTPVGLSLPFLNRLNTRDIKNLLTDKNISEAVRKMTKRVFEQRNQANQPAFKKK